MRITHYWKAIAFTGFALFNIINNLVAQEELLSVSTPTMHELKIENRSDLNLEINGLALEKSIILEKNKTTYVPYRSALKKGAKVQLSYPLAAYRRDKETLKTQILEKLPYKDMWEEIAFYTTDKDWKTIKDILKQFAISNEVVALYKNMNERKNIYQASTGKVNNGWSTNFTPFSFKQVSISKSSLPVSPLYSIDYSRGFKRQSLNSFWAKESSRITQDWTFSYKLLGEKRLGKNAKRFVNLYGFVKWDRTSYGLTSINNNTFFVDSTYIAQAPQEYFKLQSTTKVNLNIKQGSLGAFLRVHFYPNFMLDIGSGFAIYQNVELEFDSREKKGGLVQHISAPYAIADSKFKKIARLDNRLYGTLKLNYMANSSNHLRHMNGTVFFIDCRIQPQQTITPNDNFRLRYTNPNISGLKTPSFQSTDEKAFDLQFRLGISLAI